MAETAPLLAGVELGGTKCIAILGTGPDQVLDEVRVPSTDPETALAEVERVLLDWRQGGHEFQALGIASFGPVELDKSSPKYGFITSTPKPGWRDTDVAQRLARTTGVATAFDTDVNGAALAEGRWGAARGLRDFVYITVGTGVGAGLISSGRPLVGFTHTEVGHIRLARAPGDLWEGSCPFHGACVEGLAAGSAIKARTGSPAHSLPDGDPVWQLVAHALGQVLHTLVMTAAPRRILMGGGVMVGRPTLFPMIRAELARSVNGYLIAPQLMEQLDDYVVPPALGARAGPLGALALAADLLGRSEA